MVISICINVQTYGGLLGMVEFTQHSLQFRDRSLDADSSGLPKEDVDVDDSALENSLASSYWFRACEETWGGETKARNHQNPTEVDTQDVNYRNSSANAQQCSNIYDGRPRSFRRLLLACPFFLQCNLQIWTLRFGSPSFTTDRWNIRVSQLKTSSREKFLSSHDIHSQSMSHRSSLPETPWPSKSGRFPHQGAEEPQHSSHGSHESWQSWHSFSIAKSKVQKTSKEFKRLLP